MNSPEKIPFKNTFIKRNFINELPYNPNLRDYARQLRKAGNLPEVLFWKEVKNKNFHCLDFDRQRVIGNYIVDFYVKSLGLVVEVDGCSHDFKQEKDEKRQKFLESLGIRFFRISDFDVKKNLELVLKDLEDFIIDNYSDTPSSPMANPPL